MQIDLNTSRVGMIHKPCNNTPRNLFIEAKTPIQNLHMHMAIGNNRRNLHRPTHRSTQPIRRRGRVVRAHMQRRETLRFARLQDLVDVKLAAAALPAGAGAVLLRVDGLSVEEPEGGHVGVAFAVGIGCAAGRVLGAAGGHGVFGEEGFVAAGPAV